MSHPPKRPSGSIYAGAAGGAPSSPPKRQRVEQKDRPAFDNEGLESWQSTPAAAAGASSSSSSSASPWRSFKCPLPNCYWRTEILPTGPFSDTRAAQDAFLEQDVDLQRKVFKHFQRTEHRSDGQLFCPWCSSKVAIDHQFEKCRHLHMTACPNRCYGSKEREDGKDVYGVMELFPLIHAEGCKTALFREHVVGWIDEHIASRRDLSDTNYLYGDQQPDHLDIDTAKFLISRILSQLVGSDDNESSTRTRSDLAVSMLTAVAPRSNFEAQTRTRFLQLHKLRSPEAFEANMRRLRGEGRGEELKAAPPTPVAAAAPAAPSTFTAAPAAAAVAAASSGSRSKPAPAPLLAHKPLVTSPWSSAEADAAPRVPLSRRRKPRRVGAAAAVAAFVDNSAADSSAGAGSGSGSGSVPVLDIQVFKCDVPGCKVGSFSEARLAQHKLEKHPQPLQPPPQSPPPSTADLVAGLQDSAEDGDGDTDMMPTQQPSASSSSSRVIIRRGTGAAKQ